MKRSAEGEKVGPTATWVAGPQRKVRVDLGHRPNRQARVLGQRRPMSFDRTSGRATAVKYFTTRERYSSPATRGRMARRQSGRSAEQFFAQRAGRIGLLHHAA